MPQTAGQLDPHLFGAGYICYIAWGLVNVLFCSFSHTLGMGIPVFNHNPGPCKLFHGIVLYLTYLSYHLDLI